MNTVFILCGHGRYASGIGSTVEMLAGKHDDLLFVDFTEKDTDVTLREKLLNILTDHEGEQVLFICDLLGGTPYKVSAEIANESPFMEVVAGCNVASVMEVLFLSNELPIQELAEFIIETTKGSAVRFKKVTKKEADYTQTTEEGI